MLFTTYLYICLVAYIQKYNITTQCEIVYIQQQYIVTMSTKADGDFWRHECTRCGYIWYTRNKPKTCVKCRSPYWDKKRQRPATVKKIDK